MLQLYEHEQSQANISDVQQPLQLVQLYKSHPYPDTIAIPSTETEDRVVDAIETLATAVLRGAHCLAPKPFDRLAFDCAR